ncbi:uncharacterized protein KGF55_000382 [Candida pseudojiufengensis]|uniref:uncharacterized protein n=1 Tax=Candida pseudojiufengensis TaxID=497109 RepID=UPI002224EA3A|nr:uncharacterized protein KGF55_000382 [Candida pseudojiufengensis]KAI5966973.1 hypothetical protein KGF55_000382 [Candida pseudojiufengensis]
MKSTSLTFNLFSLAICSSGLYDCFSQQLPPHLIRGGHLQFLTNISLILTIIYILINLFINFKFINQYNTTILYNIVINLEFIVTLGYWTLHYILPSLLNTKELPPTFTLDFKIHLFPYLYLLLINEKRNKSALFYTGLTIGIYWSYIEFIVASDSTKLSKFAYPFLNRGGFFARCVFMIGFWTLSCLNYIFLGYIKG